MVNLMDLFRRLLNELHVGSIPRMTFSNLLSEMVDEYHLWFGVKTRHVVQKIVYAMMDLPGDVMVLRNLRSDIAVRLEREHHKIGGRMTTLAYYLPLDEKHLEANPPLKRVTPKDTTTKSTQTTGTFQSKPVQALILE